MRISLGLRLLALIGTINVAVFGAGLYFLTAKIGRDRFETEQKYAERLLYTLGSSINARGELRVEQILQWPNWDAVDDAVILDRNPRGVSLNPVGALHRNAFFDRESIEREIGRAIETRTLLRATDGFTLPVIGQDGRIWGGCWYRVEPRTEAVWRGLLPWFVLTTLLLFLGTFTVLRRYVLQPVRRLAAGARQVPAGELVGPLRVPRHSDELTDLIVTFNQMSADVRGFHEHLEVEVEAATQKAYAAEAAAMRQRRLAAMGELAAGIAHEINNPLGGMLNAVEVLDRESTTPEKRKSYHALLRGGLERIQETVAKLLRFTPRDAVLARLDLAGPVHDAIELVQHRAREQSVELVEVLPADHCIVLGQRSELGQVVLNLLVNALDALEGVEREARVEVRLERTHEHVILSVVDNGPGVDEASLERVSDLFYTTKEVGRGTGLGLALVHNVIHAHGGQVLLRNEVDGGLRVELVLPLATEFGDSGRVGIGDGGAP